MIAAKLVTYCDRCEGEGPQADDLEELLRLLRFYEWYCLQGEQVCPDCRQLSARHHQDKGKGHNNA